MKNENLPKTTGVFIPDSIWYSEELKPIDVRILGELRRFDETPEGIIEVRARRIALKANCDEKTVAKRIRLLALKKWIQIVEDTKRGGDAFKIRFLRAAVIIFLVLPGSALHKTNYADNVRASGLHNYILSDKRRNRHKRLPSKPKASEAVPEIQSRRILKTGQWALWNLPTPIHA